MLIQTNSPQKESFVKESINKSLERLLLEDTDILEVDINERTITHRLAIYLESFFPEWNVDCEYNRDHYDPKRLNIEPRNLKSNDIKATTVYPDIIVHKRKTEDNLLVIEFKKVNNGEDEKYDLNKLHACDLPPFSVPGVMRVLVWVMVNYGVSAVLLLERRRSRSGSGSTAGGKLRRGLVAQRTVRPPVVVLQSPGVGQVPGLGKVRELFSVGQLVSQAAVERFGVAVLPGRAWLDVQRLHARMGQPPPNRLGDELRPVVAADVLRHATDAEQLRQHVDHLLGRDAAIHLQRQAFPGVLVHDRQPLQRPAVGGPIVDEVPGPHVVLVLRLSTNATVLAMAQTPSFSLFLWHFQPFLNPKPIDPFPIHTPARSSQQRPDPSIAVAGMLAHQGQHLGNQAFLLLVRPTACTAGSIETDQRPARPTLGHAQLPLNVRDRRSTADRAQKFPWSASLRIALSSSASASSFFSRLFSSSRCFSRLASSAFIPPYWARQR